MCENVKIYAGIGNRNAPEHVLMTCKDVSITLSLLGYTCRSGGAIRCDRAFSSGSNSNEIFLPNSEIPDIAFTIASRYHQHWFTLKPFTKRLMARNALIILGKDLKTPVDFVVCYTHDGCETYDEYLNGKISGTGLAIAIADSYKIPVINIANPNWVERLEKLLQN